MMGHVTTATHSPHSYSYDPSGFELRKALLLPPQAAQRPDASYVLAALSGLTLLAGVLRVLAA